MAKVNLEQLREARAILDKGWFCDECGETDPPSGFYPLYAHGPNSLSGLLCNDCDRKLKERAKQVMSKLADARAKEMADEIRKELKDGRLMGEPIDFDNPDAVLVAAYYVAENKALRRNLR